MTAAAAATVAIPTLETARLRLRAPTETDYTTVEAFLCGPRAVHVGGPYDPREAWRLFAASVGTWITRGFGYWAVEERETGRLAGAVGVQQPPWFPEPELGWDLYEGYEGRGYATEAAAAARDWAVGPRALPRLVSHVDPANAASVRVAERLGARLDPLAERPHPADLIFRHAPAATE